jgi:hypothetical protein
MPGPPVFIQVFVLVLLAYGVVNNVVSERDNALDRTRIEQKYNNEHHTDIHLDEPLFDLFAALWSNSLPIIIMAFIIAYEIRRRLKRRLVLSNKLNPKDGSNPTPEPPA